VPVRQVIAAAAFILATLAVADLRGQDAAIAARTGTEALEEHRFGEALAAFSAAAAIEPDRANLSFGAGVAAFMLGQNDAARFRFERVLALDPGYLPAAVWLGDLHYRAGRLEQAISICEAALQHAPGDRDLRDRLVRWRKEQALQSRFHEVRAPHFIVLFEDSGDEPRARQFLERLDAAYSRIGSILGVYPTEPMTILIYSRQQFDDITGLAAWSIAGYDGRIRVPRSVVLEPREEIDRVLSHEYVHAVVEITGGRTVPAWINEGLATALEPSLADGTDRSTRSTRRTNLSRLHRSFTDLPKRDAEVAYAAAADAVRRLLDQRGAPAIVALLGDLRRGETFASAFEERIAMRYQEFAAERLHIDQRRW
jgi:tetratricopeptide (TPR) repeat protein